MVGVRDANVRRLSADVVSTVAAHESDLSRSDSGRTSKSEFCDGTVWPVNYAGCGLSFNLSSFRRETMTETLRAWPALSPMSTFLRRAALGVAYPGIHPT